MVAWIVLHVLADELRPADGLSGLVIARVLDEPVAAQTGRVQLLDVVVALWLCISQVERGKARCRVQRGGLSVKRTC